MDIAEDRKSTRLNSSHSQISYAVFCLKKQKLDVVRELLLRELEQPQDVGDEAQVGVPGHPGLDPPLVPVLVGSRHDEELFFFQLYRDHAELHSFPTRRSSD